jgi:outer membrane protein assembly factor BamB
MTQHRNPSALLVALTVVALCGGSASAQLADSPWPKFQHDTQNTGRSDDFVGPTTLPTSVWEEDYESPRRATPALAEDGTIYLGAGRAPLIALNPANGGLIWTPDAGLSAALDRSAPAVAADGTIYFGARDNRLWSLDPADGSLNWHFKVPADGDVSTPPTVGPDGRIYMGSDALGAGKVYKMNPNGTVVWTTNLGGGPINVSPALSHDASVVYYTSGGRRIHALSSADGSDIWEFTAQAASTGSRGFNFSPVVGKAGTIYLAARGVVVAVNADGSEKWRFDPGVSFGSPPALAADVDESGLEDAVYVVGYAKSMTLYALNPVTGTPIWEEVLLGPGKARNTPPIVDAGGNIYVAAGKVLSAFSSAGNPLWNKVFRRGFVSSPIIGGDGILYVGNGRTLFKLSD